MMKYIVKKNKEYLNSLTYNEEEWEFNSWFSSSKEDAVIFGESDKEKAHKIAKLVEGKVFKLVPKSKFKEFKLPKDIRKLGYYWAKYENEWEVARVTFAGDYVFVNRPLAPIISKDKVTVGKKIPAPPSD